MSKKKNLSGKWGSRAKRAAARSKELERVPLSPLVGDFMAAFLDDDDDQDDQDDDAERARKPVPPQTEQ